MIAPALQPRSAAEPALVDEALVDRLERKMTFD